MYFHSYNLLSFMLEMSLYCTFENSLFLRDSATLSSVASLSHVYVKFKVYSVNTSNEETRADSPGDHMAYTRCPISARNARYNYYSMQEVEYTSEPSGKQ